MAAVPQAAVVFPGVVETTKELEVFDCGLGTICPVDDRMNVDRET
jgi:hypothetical protein